MIAPTLREQSRVNQNWFFLDCFKNKKEGVLMSKGLSTAAVASKTYFDGLARQVRLKGGHPKETLGSMATVRSS